MRAVCCSLSRNLIKSLKSFPKMINFSLFLIKLKMKSCCLRLITRAWLPPLHALQDYSSININRNTLGPGIFLHSPAHVLPPGDRQVPVLPPSQVITAHPPTATPPRPLYVRRVSQFSSIRRPSTPSTNLATECRIPWTRAVVSAVLNLILDKYNCPHFILESMGAMLPVILTILT